MVITRNPATSVQVTCIILASSNAGHEGITHLGGDGWRWTREQVIAEIESPNCRYAFYTKVNGKVGWIGVRSGPYGKYLQTHADGYWNNNLLALARCY